jgi:hypothetical protein
VILFNVYVGLIHCGFGVNRGIQVRVGAMEEEAVGCDEVSAEGQVLGVPPAPFHCARHASYPPRQGSPLGLQGQAGFFMHTSSRPLRFVFSFLIVLPHLHA